MTEDYITLYCTIKLYNVFISSSNMHMYEMTVLFAGSVEK